MSYDYLFFKCTAAVRTHDDLSEQTTLPIGSVEEIKAMLTAAYPGMQWKRDGFAWLFPAEYGGEIKLFAEDGRCFSASHISAEQVQELCNRTGLVAFDGQVVKMIFPASWPDGRGEKAD